MNGSLEDRLKDAAGALGAPRFDGERFAAQAIEEGLADVAVARTGSPLGERILADWESVQSRFVKVMPHDYRAALERHHDHPVSAGGHGLFTRESETEEAA